MAKIKKGDTVVIISGKDRAKTGKVLRVFPKTGKLYIDGILRKKHKRSRTQSKKGEIISVPFPLALSNVKIVCPSCGKAARVGFSVNGEGKKVRVCKKCKGFL